MKALTVTPKGQLTLPNDILKHLGVEPGEQVVVTLLPQGCVQMKSARTRTISDVFDVPKNKGRPPLSVGKIKKIVARGWTGRR